MIYPKRLKRGDTIGLIAPAGPVDVDRLNQAVAFYETLGLCVKLGQNIDRVYGYLAGRDTERLGDLHAMVADPTVKAIMFARGGYGTGRLVSDIDEGLIRSHPKIFWGYSDITYLHIAIQKRTELITFHGPMAVSDVAKATFDPLSARLFSQLFAPSTLIYGEQIAPLHVYAHGEAKGRLAGGNLSLIISTLGTPDEIDTDGKLLLLEDIGEEPYKIDGMLNQLQRSGKLAGAAGIVLGHFTRAQPHVKPSLLLKEVFNDYFAHLNIPVIGGFEIGHSLPNLAVPLGARAYLSTDSKRLVVEPGVT